MNKASKVGVVIFLVLLLGVGGYYGYTMLFKPKDDDVVPDNPKDDEPKKDDGVNSSSTTYSFPFKTTQEGNNFRAWVNTNYSAYAKEIDLSVTGALNSYVDNAWKKYGAEYTKTSGSGTNTTTATSSNADIKTITDFASGDKASTSYLKSTNADFVKTWAKKIKDKQSAFIWANQAYTTRKGVKVLDHNPINVKHYAKIEGQIAKKEPKNDALSDTIILKGTNIGAIKNIAYADNSLWFYAPEESDYFKWYKASHLTKTKSLSFVNDLDSSLENFNGFRGDE